MSLATVVASGWFSTASRLRHACCTTHVPATPATAPRTSQRLQRLLRTTTPHPLSMQHPYLTWMQHPLPLHGYNIPSPHVDRTTLQRQPSLPPCSDRTIRQLQHPSPVLRQMRLDADHLQGWKHLRLSDCTRCFQKGSHCRSAASTRGRSGVVTCVLSVRVSTAVAGLDRSCGR
jgi:hypothetical protein